MELTRSENEGVQIVAPQGKLDTASSSSFEEELSGLVDAGHFNIILDFSSIDFIASTGLRVLIKAARQIKDNNGKFYICCVNEAAAAVFSMTGLDTILSITQTREEALAEIRG